MKYYTLIIARLLGLTIFGLLIGHHTYGQTTADITFASSPTATDGSISLNVGGGLPPYVFQWDNGEESSYITDLAAGEYCVTIYDALCCESEGCFTVESCSPESIDAELTSITPATTTASSDGAIDITVNSTNDPYTFQWSNGAATEDLNNIPTGSYYLTITDVNGCKGYLKAFVSNCKSFSYSLKPTSQITDASSATASDGAINISLKGSAGLNPNITYQWSGPNGFTANTQDISGLEPGTYCVIITDYTCQRSYQACFEVGFPCPDNLILGIQHHGFIDCPGGTGMLTVSLLGTGTPPYSFEWSNGETTQTIDDLPAGYYGITVTDANDCEDSFGINLTEPDPMVVKGLVTDVGCNGSGGSINLTVVMGGEAPFTYLWNDGVTTEDRTNLSAGEYCVTVTDNDGCEKERCFTVGMTSITVGVASVDNVSFCSDDDGGLCNGAIDINVSGDGPFSYEWSGPNGFSATTQDISSLCPGNYVVTVTGANGCTKTRSVNICCCSTFNEPGQPPSSNDCFGGDPPQSLSLTGTVTPPTNGNNGSINITVTGGTYPRYYDWSGPGGYSANTQDISNLSPGNYCVTVTDGCSSKTKCFEVVECDESSLSVNGSTNRICQGVTTGSVTINVSGGNSPYSIIWNNGSTSQNLTGLTSGGNYCVTVTDASGCEVTGCYNVPSYQVVPEPNYGACRVDYTCDGEVLWSEDYRYIDFSDADCSYYALWCGLTNTMIDPYYQYVGTTFIPYNNCVVEEVCLNGDFVQNHYGNAGSDIVSGFDQAAGCWYCFYVEYCEITIGGQQYFYLTSEPQSQLGISYTPNSGCASNCYARIYCGWDVIAEGCSSDCNEQACSSFGLVANEQTETIDRETVTVTRFEGTIEHSIAERLMRENGLVRSEATLINRGELENVAKRAPVIPSKPESEVHTDNLDGIKVYPNPFNNQINIAFEISEPSNSVIIVRNTLGQIVIRKSVEAEKGENITTIDFDASTPSGTYFVELLHDNGVRIVEKVIKY